MKTLLLVVALLGATAHTFKEVTELDPKGLQQWLKSPKPVIIMFYAPWCGHCQKLIPDYEKVAKNLKDIVRVGAVNCDVHKDLAGKYQVKGFPTLKSWKSGKKGMPNDYQQERSAKALTDHGISLIASNVKKTKTEKELEALFDGAGINNVVVLFSEKANIPPIWKAISSSPPLSSYAFGIASKTDKLTSSLSVKKYPAIAVFNPDNKLVPATWYKGSIAYTDIAKWLQNLAGGGGHDPNDMDAGNDSEEPKQEAAEKKKPAKERPPPPPPAGAEVMTLAEDKFLAHCVRNKRLCVVAFGHTDADSQVMKDVAARFARDKAVRVFVSKPDDAATLLDEFNAALLPDEVIKSGDVVLLRNSARGGKFAIHHGISFDPVVDVVDRVVGGDMRLHNAARLPFYHEVVETAKIVHDDDLCTADGDASTCE